MSDELKPCPFCGSAAELLYHHSNNSTLPFPNGNCYVECVFPDCSANLDQDLPMGEAVALWNTRAQPAATGGRVVEHPPEYIHEWTDDEYDQGKQIGMDDRDEEWRAALAKAGVRVSE